MDEARVEKLREACPVCGRRPNQRMRETSVARDSAWADLVTERQMAEAYYRALETHLRAHGCTHNFGDVADDPAALEVPSDAPKGA